VQRLRGVLQNVGRDLLGDFAGVEHRKAEVNPGKDPREERLISRGCEARPAASHARKVLPGPRVTEGITYSLERATI
jgi:hypothetical protein